MNIVLIGNIISLVGCGLMVICGLIKDRKKTIFVQTVMMLVMAAANFTLGGITGGFTNIISASRNYIVYKEKYNNWLKALYLVILVGMSVVVNNSGWLGWLPIISAGAYTLFLDIKSDMGLKIIMGSTQAIWIVYDLCLHNYVATAFDIATFISCIITIIRIQRTKEK